METSGLHLNLGCLFTTISMKGRWCLLWVFHSTYRTSSNLVYTSARLRAPPATSQKWLIISSRNIFSDAWRHLCSVWRTWSSEKMLQDTTSWLLRCLVFNILHSPPLLRVQYSLPWVQNISTIHWRLKPIYSCACHQLTSHPHALDGHSCQNVW